MEAQTEKVVDSDEADELHPDAVILYKSTTKNFWRTGTVVEFKMVEHRQYMVIELIPRNTVTVIEAPRTYLNTSLLFSKFSVELIDFKIAEKKIQFYDENKYNKRAEIPPDSKIREKVLQDLVTQFVKDRLVVPMDGVFEVWLTVLPGDLTAADGSLDVVCEKPHNLKEYETEEIGRKTKSKKTWASSLRAIDPDWARNNFPVELGIRSNIVSTINQTEEEILASLRKNNWRRIFSRFILIMEITKMKRRLEVLNIKYALNSEMESLYVEPKALGANSRRYSEIFRAISAGPIVSRVDVDSDDSDVDSIESVTTDVSNSSTARRGTDHNIGSNFPLRESHSKSMDLRRRSNASHTSDGTEIRRNSKMSKSSDGADLRSRSNTSNTTDDTALIRRSNTSKTSDGTDRRKDSQGPNSRSSSITSNRTPRKLLPVDLNQGGRGTKAKQLEANNSATPVLPDKKSLSPAASPVSSQRNSLSPVIPRTSISRKVNKAGEIDGNSERKRSSLVPLTTSRRVAGSDVPKKESVRITTRLSNDNTSQLSLQNESLVEEELTIESSSKQFTGSPKMKKKEVVPEIPRSAVLMAHLRSGLSFSMFGVKKRSSITGLLIPCPNEDVDDEVVDKEESKLDP